MKRSWPHLEIKIESIYCGRIKTRYIEIILHSRRFFLCDLWEPLWYIARTRARTVHSLFSADDVKKRHMAHVRNWEEEGGRWVPNINTIRFDPKSHTFRACLRIRCIAQNAEHTVCSYTRRPLLLAAFFSWWPRKHPKGNIIRFVKVNCKVKLYGARGASSLCSKILRIITRMIELLVSRYFKVIAAIIIMIREILVKLLIITHQV